MMTATKNATSSTRATSKEQQKLQVYAGDYGLEQHLESCANNATSTSKHLKMNFSV